MWEGGKGLGRGGLETAPPLLSPETKGLFFGVALGRLLTVDSLRARWQARTSAPYTIRSALQRRVYMSVRLFAAI